MSLSDDVARHRAANDIARARHMAEHDEHSAKRAAGSVELGKLAREFAAEADRLGIAPRTVAVVKSEVVEHRKTMFRAMWKETVHVALNDLGDGWVIGYESLPDDWNPTWGPRWIVLRSGAIVRSTTSDVGLALLRRGDISNLDGNPDGQVVAVYPRPGEELVHQFELGPDDRDIATWPFLKAANVRLAIVDYLLNPTGYTYPFEARRP